MYMQVQYNTIITIPGLLTNTSINLDKNGTLKCLYLHHTPLHDHSGTMAIELMAVVLTPSVET